MENFSFLKAHIVVRSEMKHIGKIPTATPDDEDDEDDDDLFDESLSQTQGETPADVHPLTN